jgi:hypothetical protein
MGFGFSQPLPRRSWCLPKLGTTDAEQNDTMAKADWSKLSYPHGILQVPFPIHLRCSEAAADRGTAPHRFARIASIVVFTWIDDSRPHQILPPCGADEGRYSASLDP